MLATAQVGEVSFVKTHLNLFILDLSSGITSVFANAHSARWTWTLMIGCQSPDKYVTNLPCELHLKLKTNLANLDQLPPQISNSNLQLKNFHLRTELSAA